MSLAIWRLFAGIGLVVLICPCAALDAQVLPSTSSPIVPYVRPAPYEIRFPARTFVPQVTRPDWDGLLAKGDSRGVHVVVQLTKIPNLDTRAALAEAGINLGQPLSGNAYLA